MKIFGLDISLDHGGVVVLDTTGMVADYCFLTTVKKYASVDPKHSVLLSKQEKDEPKAVFRLRRMNEYLHGLMEFEHKVSTLIPPSYYSIEGYSYGSAGTSTSICQIAELTGYIKHMTYEGGGLIRIHDPLSVKLFATSKGVCLKKDIVERARLMFDFPDGLIKKKMIKKKGKKIPYSNPTCTPGVEPITWNEHEKIKVEEYDGPATDLADAYFLARMTHTELQLRNGELLLKQLSEGERRIFLRVTKMYPVNVLDRPFICKRGKS